MGNRRHSDVVELGMDGITCSRDRKQFADPRVEKKLNFRQTLDREAKEAASTTKEVTAITAEPLSGKVKMTSVGTVEASTMGDLLSDAQRLKLSALLERAGKGIPKV